ncbi:hypothetical protein Q9F26_004630 [Vibrio parahaemolyticus]|nr:hypothetical protein [Vibrio parahaemolyticus]
MLIELIELIELVVLAKYSIIGFMLFHAWRAKKCNVRGSGLIFYGLLGIISGGFVGNLILAFWGHMFPSHVTDQLKNIAMVIQLFLMLIVAKGFYEMVSMSIKQPK